MNVLVFFNPISDVRSFLNAKKKPLSRTDYNKLSAIVLSNGITLNERRDNDSWDLEKAINIVLMNPTAKSHCIWGLQVLSEFFPHKTCDYFRMLFENKQKYPDVPELCWQYTFVSDNGFDINKEKEKKR